MHTQLHHLIEHQVESRGSAPALVYKKTELTYAELWEQCREFGSSVQRIGLNRQDRIAVYMEKRVETVVALFGTSVAGNVMVPINPLLRAQQVSHILQDCGVRVLVTTPERVAVLRDSLNQCPELAAIILIDESSDPAPELPVAYYRWTEFLSAEPSVLTARQGIDIDIAAILYTSGSTGKPKGVVLSHRNLIAGASSVNHYLQNSADDVILAVLPLSFDAGFSQLTTAFHAGAQVVLMNYLLASDVVRQCELHAVTGLTCVPPLWNQIAGQQWPEEVSGRLRYFANTGGRMPKTTLDRLRECFSNAVPFLMYGLTESFRSTYLDPQQVDSRPDSIGKAIPNAEVIVARPDGTVCDPGEEGELVHRGALVAIGYWNNPEATAERFRPAPGTDQAWRQPELAVWSGDRVVTDQDGFLYFVGRSDEMIKTSGYRVSPTEIEEVAYATGLVRDVVALGLDDAALGQRIVLVVSPAGSNGLDVEALRSALRHQLPRYMVPTSVFVCDELPRSPNGKFDRVKIRGELDR